MTDMQGVQASTAETSVILRRQVPVRFDEIARSWLGGLPQMPRSVSWPCASTDGAALSFIAQICCADLPEKIWGGRGPKKGWLLLFVDKKQLVDSDDGDLVQVLHIDQLGPEQRPPGAGFPRLIASQPGSTNGEGEARVKLPPIVYRRWPIDIVEQSIPSPPPADSEEMWAPWYITGAELYGAAEDAAPIGNISQAEPQPHTWRAALNMVDKVIDHYKLKETIDHRTKQKVTFCSALNQFAIPSEWEPGWLEKAKANAGAALAEQAAHAHALETWLDEHASERATEPYAQQKRRLADARRWFPSGERIVSELAQYSGAEGETALARQIEHDARLHAAWVESARPRLARLRAHILAQDIDADMPDTEWARLKAQMLSDATKYWGRPHGKIGLGNVQRTLLDDAVSWLRDSPRDRLLDMYTRSAAARATIPAEQIAMLEPKLRHINVVPHRMGGPRDVLQDSSTEPGDGDLLFQLDSDGAMGWMWADLGALFVYIDPAELRVRRFTHIHAWLVGG